MAWSTPSLSQVPSQIPLSTAVFAQDAPAQANPAKQDRWEGMVIRTNQDKSTLNVRKVGRARSNGTCGPGAPLSAFELGPVTIDHAQAVLDCSARLWSSERAYCMNAGRFAGAPPTPLPALFRHNWLSK